MNQKKKIIITILLSSFLYGSPIIFFVLSNNLFFKKKENEKNKQAVVVDKDHQKSSSFLFWIIFTIIIFAVLTFIAWAFYNYKSRQKLKEKKEEKKKKIKKEKKIKKIIPPRIEIPPKIEKKENKQNEELIKKPKPLIKMNGKRHLSLQLGNKNKELKIVFCKKLDTDALFKKLWQLDIKNNPALFNNDPNNPENIFNKESQKIIRALFDSTMKIFNLLDADNQLLWHNIVDSAAKSSDSFIVNLIIKSLDKTKCDILIMIANFVVETKKDFSISIKEIESNNFTEINNTSTDVRDCVQQQKHISLFKKLMKINKSAEQPYLIKTNNEDQYYFKYFTNFFYFLTDLRKEMEYFFNYYSTKYFSTEKSTYQSCLQSLKDIDTEIDQLLQ